MIRSTECDIVTRCDSAYEDGWILNGTDKVFEQCDYKAFRYVCLVPSSPDIQIDQVVAIVRHGAFDGSRLVPSKAPIRFWSRCFNLCKNGVKCGTTYAGFSLTVPPVVKGQYAGDMTVTSRAAAVADGRYLYAGKGACSITLVPQKSARGLWRCFPAR